MASPYRVGIELSLINNFSGAFAVIMREITGATLSVKTLEAAIKKLPLAVAGVAGAFVGWELGKALKSGLDHAKELSHELVQMQKAGETPAEYAAAYKAVMELPAKIAGTTSQTGAKVWTELFSVLGADETTKNLERLSAFTMSMANTQGITFEKAAENLRDMVRSADLMRKFVDPATGQTDYGRLEHFLEVGSRVITATGGKVGPKVWLQMAQQGGPSLATMSDEGLMTMAIVSQYMGGHRAGTAMTSLAQQFIGGKMSQMAAQHAQDLGLVGGYTVGRGGKLTWDKGALDTPFAQAMQKDPELAARILESALVSHGFDTPEKQTAELYKFASRATTQRFISDTTGNLPQIVGERTRMQGAMGITAGNQLANSQDYEQVMKNLNAAWTDLLGKGFMPLAQAAIPYINSLTKALVDMGQWAGNKENAQYLKYLGEGLAVLSAALMGGGAVALLACLGPAGWLAAGLIAAGGAALVFRDGFTGPDGVIEGFIKIKNLGLDVIATGIKTLGDSIATMWQHVKDTLNAIGKYIPGWKDMSGNFIRDFGAGALPGGTAYPSSLTGSGYNADMIRKYGGKDAAALMAIARTEGGLGQYTGPGGAGDSGTSWGPFQMHFGGPGSQANILAAQGINVRDPASLPAQIAYMRKYGATHGGWGGDVWHGIRDSLHRSRVAPGAGGGDVTINNVIHMDGRKVAEGVLHHATRAARYASSVAAAPDGHSQFMGPGSESWG